MITYIVDHLTPVKREIDTLTPQQARFNFYQGKYSGSYHVSYVLDDEEKLCCVDKMMIPKFNKSIYFTNANVDGLTFNKKTKKVHIWFGRSLKSFIELGIFSHFMRITENEWFNNMPRGLKVMVNNTILSQILSKKITNPEQYVKKFISMTLKAKNVVHWRLVKEYAIITSNPFMISDFINYTTNPNVCLSKLIDIHHKRSKVTLFDSTVELNRQQDNILDSIKQCQMLDKKINPNWSDKRLEKEHMELTRKVAEMKLGEKSDIDIPYYGADSLELPNSSSFIRNERGLFLEGQEMSHCVYTYWGRVRDKKYFVIKCHTPERCTVGITFNSKNEAFLHQIYLKYDKPVKQETREIFEEWLKDEKVQIFFRENNGTLEYEMKKSSLMAYPWDREADFGF